MPVRLIYFSVQRKLFFGLAAIFLSTGDIFRLPDLAADVMPDITSNQVRMITITPSVFRI